MSNNYREKIFTNANDDTTQEDIFKKYDIDMESIFECKSVDIAFKVEDGEITDYRFICSGKGLQGFLTFLITKLLDAGMDIEKITDLLVDSSFGAYQLNNVKSHIKGKLELETTTGGLKN